MKGVGRESGHASINKILLLLYHDQGLSVITTLLLGSGEAWIRVQRVSQGLAMHAAGPRGRRAGRGVQGTAMPINKLHHHKVGLFMAFGFLGRRSKTPIQWDSPLTSGSIHE